MTRARVFVTSVHALIAPDFSGGRLGGAVARSQTRFRGVSLMSETAQRTGVSAALVTEDEAGMRLDRWFKRRFPALTLSHLAKICRKGEVRVDGKKVETSTRLEQGQTIRIPPLNLDAQEAPRPARVNPDDARDIAQMTLFEDKDVMVLNKPYGLAVQGGSGTTRHIDGMLASLAEGDRRPVLVHRLDRDTSGVLMVAKNRRAAAELGEAFRSRQARKIYWALVEGVPKPSQGRISLYLAKGSGMGDERVPRKPGAGTVRDLEKMRVARHGEADAQHSLTYYAIVDKAAPRCAWLSMKPLTGRTHQLRAHAEAGDSGGRRAQAAPPGATADPAASQGRNDRRDGAPAAAYARDLGFFRV